MTPYFSQSSKRVCVPEFEQSALAAAHNSAGARDHRQRAQEIRVSLFYLLQDEENMQTSQLQQNNRKCEGFTILSLYV